MAIESIRRRGVSVSGQGGFTFIELTVVIAILALLGQVVVPAFMKNGKAAHEAGAGGGIDIASVASSDVLAFLETIPAGPCPAAAR